MFERIAILLQNHLLDYCYIQTMQRQLNITYVFCTKGFTPNTMNIKLKTSFQFVPTLHIYQTFGK